MIVKYLLNICYSVYFNDIKILNEYFIYLYFLYSLIDLLQDHSHKNKIVDH